MNNTLLRAQQDMFPKEAAKMLCTSKPQYVNILKKENYSILVVI